MKTQRDWPSIVGLGVGLILTGVILAGALLAGSLLQ